MDQHNRDLHRQELDSAREAEYDARSFEEAWARAAAAEEDPAPDDADRAWWAALNTAFHSTPPAPRYHVEPWDVADGFFRVIDSHGDVVVSTHFGLDCALRLLEVLNHPAFGDDTPTDPDPAGEARPGLAGHDAEAGR